MARPSRNLDKILIEAGKKRIMKSGISAISIRSICTEHGINLGMFHYHFKTKENYIKIIFKSLNEDLHNYWAKETEGINDPLDKLKKILLINTKIFKEQRGVFETIIRDLNIFDEFYQQIAKEMHFSWRQFFYTLIDECKKDNYLDKNISNDKMVFVFSGAIMSYSKYCIASCSDEQYYKNMKEMINLLIEKFK